MAPRKRVTVKQWIEDALADADKGKPCSAISLVLLRGGVGQEEIHTRNLSGPQDSGKLADFFINKATGYAQDLPDIQTFKLLAFYGENEPQAAFPFTVAEGQLTGGEEIPFSRHEATEKGALGLALKYLDRALTINMQMVQGIAATSMQRDQEMSRERNEMTMILRDVLLTQRKESHEMRLKELEFQRSSEERRMIGKAVPSIVNYLSGRELVPETYADSELIEGLATKISPEDLQLLVSMGKISSQEAALLAQRFMKAREENEKRKQAIRSLPAEEDDDHAVGQLNGKAPEKETH